MKRYGQVLRLKPGNLEKYEKYHAEVWPSVIAAITESNIENYSIFFKENWLFSYLEYTGNDFDSDMQKMAENKEVQRWWALMMPMQQPLKSAAKGEWWATMKEVFHTE